ncbi:hypothetical protein BDR22DRAFT_888300 [Usnea florida]
MTDYHDKGFAVIDLMDPRFAADLWRDIDKDEIRKLTGKMEEMPWKALKNVPQTQSAVAFSQEVDNNMWKCWERYGKKSMEPKVLKEHFRVFLNTKNIIETSSVKHYVLVFIPLITMSQREGLPSLMGGSHRQDAGVEHKPFGLVLQPGQALMFNARLKTRQTGIGGGTLLVRVYDVTGM